MPRWARSYSAISGAEPNGTWLRSPISWAPEPREACGAAGCRFRLPAHSNAAASCTHSKGRRAARSPGATKISLLRGWSRPWPLADARGTGFGNRNRARAQHTTRCGMLRSASPRGGAFPGVFGVRASRLQPLGWWVGLGTGAHTGTAPTGSAGIPAGMREQAKMPAGMPALPGSVLCLLWANPASLETNPPGDS